MARKGRDLELLVARIEEVLVPQGAVVKSPDYIVDRVTGDRREVDVSIRMQVGSVPVLIVIECRDREDVEDVTWIEQLAQKCSDLRAKGVAVSSAGFSAGAEKKAAFWGIETRRIDELTPAAISGWFQAGELTLRAQRVEILYAAFNLDRDWKAPVLGEDERNRLSQAVKSAKPLVCKTDGVECGFDAVWAAIRNRPGLYDGVPDDGTAIERELMLNFTNPSQRYQLRVGSELVDIVEMPLVVKLWIEKTTVPIDKMYAYRDQEKSYAEGVEYRIEVDNQPRLVSIVNDGRGVALNVTPAGSGTAVKKDAAE